MNRLRFSLLAAMCLILPASSAQSAPVPATRSGLDQIPATAPLVLHMRGLQGTRDRFVVMMENALPDVLAKIKPQIDNFLENGAEGRKVRGLAKDGPFFLIFTELPKPDGPFPDPLPLAFVLAVTSYKDFRDNFLTEEERKSLKDEGNGIESASLHNSPKLLYFLNRKGYAVVTPDKSVAETFTKKFKGIDSKMSKEQAAKLLASDFGVFVNMDMVTTQYRDQINEAKKGLQDLINMGEGAGDESTKTVLAIVKKAIGPVFQAVEDMQAVLATVELRPGGLGLHLQSEMKESTTTANLLQDSRPTALKDMGRLPPGRAYYLGMKTSAALYKGLGSLMVGIPLGKSGEESKEVADALKELANAGPVDRLDGFSFPMSGLQIYHFDEPAKAVAAQVKLMKFMAESDPKSVGLREKAKLKMDAEQFGDFKLHSLEMALDFDKMAEPFAQQGEAVKKQFIEGVKGLLGDKMTLWFGTDGKAVITVSAPDWETARKHLEQYSKGSGTVGDSKAFRDARKEMPAQTSVLGLVDAVHLFGIIFDAVRPIIPVGGLPPGWPNMPAKGGPVGYVGLSVTLQPNRGALDLFITAAAAQEFYKAIVKPLLRE
jgi:hypothetical protein